MNDPFLVKNPSRESHSHLAYKKRKTAPPPPPKKKTQTVLVQKKKWACFPMTI